MAIDHPFPMEGTITPKSNGRRMRFDAPIEWVTENGDGPDYMEMATDRAAREYGEGTEVQVRFTGNRHGEVQGYELLGAVED